MSLCRSGWGHLRNLLLWELLNQKKKSHLRVGLKLYGHFSSQNSVHRWLESCACDNSELLSINNTCHFCFTETVTDCCKWLSSQGPACSPRVHFSSIPNLKGLSSIRPATIATRPWPWVTQPLRSSQVAALRPELQARASVRYVPFAVLRWWAHGEQVGSKSVEGHGDLPTFLCAHPTIHRRSSSAVSEGKE
jgi:hypothetical protein